MDLTPDTVSVEYEVVALERFERGPIMAVADVLLRIADVEVVVKGITMRRDGAEHARVTVPTYRHPRTGEWKPSLDLPPVVWAAISTEIAETVTGRPARLVA